MRITRAAATFLTGFLIGQWLGACHHGRPAVVTVMRPNGAVYHKTYDAAGRVEFHAHAAGFAGCRDCPPQYGR